MRPASCGGAAGCGTSCATRGIWIFASIIGMALPCMMSLEFIRNATVTGDRVAAMSAEGIAMRYPSTGQVFWFLTLLCGFLVLAPGQVSAGDQIARRWTDMIWTVGTRKPGSPKRDVRYVYYGILAGYCVCGLVILSVFAPLTDRQDLHRAAEHRAGGGGPAIAVRQPRAAAQGSAAWLVRTSSAWWFAACSSWA